MSKATRGKFFEDFRLGQKLVHATPRTLGQGDAALYIALYGSRFALQSSEAFARGLHLAHSPLDDLLVFHTVFGKTVPDISLNAMANLGYAQGIFHGPVFPGTTLRAVSEIIGLKENSNRRSGVVYVRTEALDEAERTVLSYVRWVMVRKRDPNSESTPPCIPQLARSVQADMLRVPTEIDFRAYDTSLSGSPFLWDDYVPGEKIDHIDGVTIEEAEHMMATRLYQNTARVHFNQLAQATEKQGRRLVYGGHVISIARALSFNGLGNALMIAAINGGRHVNPIFAGDTVFAWSQIVDKAELADRADCGALRLRLVATKNLPCSAFPDSDAEGQYPDNVILDFDYWAIVPRRL